MMRSLLLSCLLLAAPLAFANEELDSRFTKDIVIVEASNYACYRFDTYLAIDNEQRSRGLMFVRDLPLMTGMLFVYKTQQVSMWMKNTFIPLDMLFIREDGSVSSIIRNTEPQSLKSLYSTEPVAFVLELNAGTTLKLGIDENSRIIWEPVHGNVE